MRKHTFLAVFLLSVFAASARADLLYSFSFTPTEGPIESFAFSFDVPAFVTTGQSPAFDPFTLTDGTNSASLTEDLAENTTAGNCFVFLTATGASSNSECDIDVHDNGAAVRMVASGGLPTMTGTFTYDAAAVLGTGSEVEGVAGTVDLTITNTPLTTPEPSSWILMSTTLLAVAFVARKSMQRTRTLHPSS
jgi:hypothetical protein